MPPESDIFKILVATDVHLGYAENDPLRARDSVDTFEEILQISQEHDVDFILFGGDLFHENKPSRWIMHECVRLLRQYCMSSKPINFEFLSDASVNFSHSQFPHPNYQDENLNVGTPVFTINGNHDDVTGRNLCALDILHEAGLVNYFGKYTSVEKIEITPLLLRKNNTRIALFGLGAVRDERLHRMFLRNQVKFFTLSDKRSAKDDWFNLLVLHQNRVRHGLTNYIPEKMLPDFFDLVIWGHEHPCLIDPTPSCENEFYVMQPGSSVATSLCEGESGDKYVAILKVDRKNFQSQKVKLKTVRPFYFENVNLSETDIRPNRNDTLVKMENLCKRKVEEYIKKAGKEESSTSRRPKEPLIRLSVHLWPGVEEAFNVQRFGHQFVNRVANSRDIILFHRHKEPTDRSASALDRDVAEKVVQDRSNMSSRVEDYIVKYFESVAEDNQLTVLTECGMAEALKHFVDKEEKESIGALYKHQAERCKERLKREKVEDLSEQNIIDMLKQIHQLRLKKDKTSIEEDQRDIEDALKEATLSKTSVVDISRVSATNGVVNDSDGDDNSDLTMSRRVSAMDVDDFDVDIDDNCDDGDFNASAATSSRRRGRGRARGGGQRGPRTASGGRRARGTRASGQSVTSSSIKHFLQ